MFVANYLEFMPLKQTDLIIHKAAQYLASFGKQYIQGKEDDSHTNLAWDSDKSALRTRATLDNQQLSLFLEDLRLTWTKDSSEYSLSLQNRSHGEVCVWLHHIALRFGVDEYDFHLHYKLDSGKLNPDDFYIDYDSERAKALIALRNLAQSACEELTNELGLNTEIRVWPHHFDTGGYASLPGSNLAIGFGMATPDSLIDHYYLYIAAYKSKQQLSTSEFTNLENGEWFSGSFNGATLIMSEQTKQEHSQFFKTAIQQYLKAN